MWGCCGSELALPGPEERRGSHCVWRPSYASGPVRWLTGMGRVTVVLTQSSGQTHRYLRGSPYLLRALVSPIRARKAAGRHDGFTPALGWRARVPLGLSSPSRSKAPPLHSSQPEQLQGSRTQAYSCVGWSTSERNEKDSCSVPSVLTLALPPTAQTGSDGPRCTADPLPPERRQAAVDQTNKLPLAARIGLRQHTFDLTRTVSGLTRRASAMSSMRSPAARRPPPVPPSATGRIGRSTPAGRWPERARDQRRTPVPTHQASPTPLSRAPASPSRPASRSHRSSPAGTRAARRVTSGLLRQSHRPARPSPCLRSRPDASPRDAAGIPAGAAKPRLPDCIR